MLKEGHHLVLQTGNGTKIKDQKQVIQKNYIKAGKFQHTFILTKKKKSESKDKGYTHAPQNRNQKYAIYQDGKV